MVARQITSTHGFAVELDDSGYEVWLIVGPRGRGCLQSPTPELLDEVREELRHLLSTHKVRLGKSVLERIEQYLEVLANSDGSEALPERYLIADGTRPAEAVDARFEWAQSETAKPQQPEEDEPDRFDHYTRNFIRTVAPGTVIGRITPCKTGHYGCDVYGRQVSPCRLQPVQFRLGPGLSFREGDSGDVVTTVAGRVELVANELRISEVLTIPRAVDFKSGNIDAVVPVCIRGDVRPRFQVRSTKDIRVDGDIENAAVDAGGDLFVRGGIFGHEGPYRTVARGSIHARVVDGATLRAGRDVEIAREIKSSDVKAGGHVRLLTGTALGGRIYAYRGMELRAAGSAAGVPTELVVGDPCEVPFVQANEAAPASDTDQSGAGTSADQAVSAEPRERPRLPRSATIEVQGVVHGGVRIVIDCREVLIRDSLRGPMRFERNGKEIIVVNLRTNARTALVTSPASLQPQGK